MMILPVTNIRCDHSWKYIAQLFFCAFTLKWRTEHTQITLYDYDVIGQFCLCLSSLSTCLSGVTFAPPPQVICTCHCSQ